MISIFHEKTNYLIKRSPLEFPSKGKISDYCRSSLINKSFSFCPFTEICTVFDGQSSTIFFMIETI